MNQLSHHAYIVEGPLSLLPKVATHARELFGFPTEHAPDVVVQEFEKLGVEEAAALREQAALKSTVGKALFVIGFSTIMSEAQQSLLKLLEEPQQGTVFVLLAPYGSLLPTVYSRLLPYPHTFTSEQVGSDAKKFLSAPYKTRTTHVAALLKEEGGERERARVFLHDLETLLYAALPKARDKKSILEGLSDVAKVRSYMGDRSPALKMLLEHLALALPQI